MQTLDRTAPEIDNHLAAAYVAIGIANSARDAAMERLHQYVGDEHTGRPARWTMTDEQALATAAREREEHPEAHIRERLDHWLRAYQTGITSANAVRTAVAEPLEEQYRAAGGWPRYYQANSADGHIHRHENCSTCHRGRQRTQLTWRTDMSGSTVEQAIAVFGRTMCTTCFPSAPADPAFAQPSQAQRQAAETRAAKQAERDAAKAAKAITDVDGSPLRVRISGAVRTIETLAAAQTAIRDSWFAILVYGSQRPDVDRTPERQAIETLLAAIAHKTGKDLDTLREDFKTKAERNARKFLK